MGIDPDGVMTPVLHLAALGHVAVGEERRVRGLIGLNTHRIARQYVRPVEEIGDGAEALCLALRAEAAAGHVEPFEMRVVRWADAGDDVEIEGGGRGVDGQLAGLDEILICRQRRAIDGDALQFEPFALQHQRRRFSAHTAHMAARRHDRRFGIKREDERNLVDQIGRGRVLA